MEIMRFYPKEPPREFEVGFGKKVIIRDCGVLELAADEQVTLITEQGGEYDVTRKSWGFYATPSMNGRLSSFGLRAALVKNRLNRHFVLLVENACQHAFQQYCEQEPLTVVAWLDDPRDLERIGRAIS
jgi:hypothetical protein